MPERSEARRRGYLEQDFRLVRLKDALTQSIDAHYHTFDKLVFFLRGKAAYVVEGQRYALQPWDVVLVPHHAIHKPLIDPTTRYERVVLWLGQDWLRRRRDAGEPLDACLAHSRDTGCFRLALRGEGRLACAQIIRGVEDALHTDTFGAGQMADILCQQLLIQVSREALRVPSARAGARGGLRDEDLSEIRRYIAGHLEDDLSVDALAGRFFLSRYHLMRRFKAATGHSLHQYVIHKRLLRAGELIRQGTPVMEAAAQAGFTEYSSFLRAFRSTFHTSPRQLK